METTDETIGKLKWRAHTIYAADKGKAMTTLLRPLIERRSNFDLRNRRLLLRTMIVSVAAKTNRKIFNWFKIRPILVDALWYVKNATISRNLEIPTIKKVYRERTASVYAKV